MQIYNILYKIYNNLYNLDSFVLYLWKSNYIIMYKIEAFILTDYFYDFIAEQIDIENEKFTIEFDVNIDDCIFSAQRYEEVEVLNIIYKRNVLDIPEIQKEKIKRDCYDDMINEYFLKQSNLY